MNLHEIGILYRRELRSALRERAIIVYSILMPIFLYPVMLWAVFSGITLVQGLSEGFTSRVALYDLPAEHAAIRDRLAAMENVELADDPPPTPELATTLVRTGELDAAVSFRAASGDAAQLEDNFVARITYDQSEERSRRAEDRVSELITAYRRAWLEQESRTLGIPPEELAQFGIDRRNVASSREIGTSVLSVIIPFFLVIMVAMGCFYPAVDSTAGERERSTWETLMTVSASRTSVMTAKYLYVATMGIAAAVLNVVAIMVTIGGIMGPIAGDELEPLQFGIPARAVIVMTLGAVGLALLFGALMLVLAAFARTFKDGQSMITPVYYLAILPGLFVAEPDIALDPGLAAVPVANMLLVMRDAIQGSYEWLYIAESLGVTLLLVAASVALARWILGFEELLIGSYGGNLWKFIKERGFRGRRAEV